MGSPVVAAHGADAQIVQQRDGPGEQRRRTRVAAGWRGADGDDTQALACAAPERPPVPPDRCRRRQRRKKLSLYQTRPSSRSSSRTSIGWQNHALRRVAIIGGGSASVSHGHVRPGRLRRLFLLRRISGWAGQNGGKSRSEWMALLLMRICHMAPTITLAGTIVYLGLTGPKTSLSSWPRDSIFASGRLEDDVAGFRYEKPVRSCAGVGCGSSRRPRRVCVPRAEGQHPAALRGCTGSRRGCARRRQGRAHGRSPRPRPMPAPRSAFRVSASSACCRKWISASSCSTARPRTSLSVSRYPPPIPTTT